MGDLILLLLAIAAAFGGTWTWHMRRHPWRKCRRCTGTGRHDDTTMFKGTSGRCTCCNSTGRHVRLDTRWLMPDYARRLDRGERGRWA